MARYSPYSTHTGSESWAAQAESASTYASFGYENELVRSPVHSPGWRTTRIGQVFNFDDGVDWSRLGVLDPCVTKQTH